MHNVAGLMNMTDYWHDASLLSYRIAQFLLFDGTDVLQIPEIYSHSSH